MISTLISAPPTVGTLYFSNTGSGAASAWLGAASASAAISP
jgi:hypothetical protein